MNVAAYISATVTALRRANLLQQRDALLAKLERDLHAAGPALDALIARFAQGLLDAGGAAPEDEELRAGSPAGGGQRADGLVRRTGRKVGG